MTQLAVAAIITGTIIAAWSALVAIMSRHAGTWITGFPRNVWAGRALAAVDVAWVLVLLLNSGFKWVDDHMFMVILMAPVMLALIIVFVDDLLAARALGGLFLLAPQAILDAAFVHPSAGRLVMTVLAYILVVLGIVWVWSPFMFRKMTARWADKPMVARATGAAGCVVGAAILLLGLFVY